MTSLASARRFVWTAVLTIAAAAAVARAQAPPRTTHLVIVVDGLRPDYITPDLMPRLLRLGRRGVVFNRVSYSTTRRVLPKPET